MNLLLDIVKEIYRRAIDAKASDGEGAAWWEAVTAEVVAVIRVENTAGAAAIIS
jgi:hypothetical protein